MTQASAEWSWPDFVPRAGEVPALRLSRPTLASLGNGVEVVVVPRHRVPRVEFRLSVPAGAAIGASAAASELLRAGLLLGTDEMDQGQVSESVQRLGGSLLVHQDQDRLEISAAALSEAEEDLYQLVAEVVGRPAFPARDLLTERVKLIEGLRSARASAQFLAAEELQQLLYPDHPYGRPEPTEKEIRRVGGDELRSLHRLTFLPAAAQITVVGDVRPGRTVTRLERAFGAWRGRGRGPRVGRLARSQSPEVAFVDRPGSVQSVILGGVSAPPLGDPRQLALQLASAVLGGGLNSRLMANLREDKGYTYGAHTQSESHLQDTLIGTEIEVRTEVTAAAFVELAAELGRIATVPVPGQELAENRRYLAGVRVVFLETQAALASTLAQLRGQGLDHRYLEDYSRELAAIGPDEVLAASGAYLGPGRMTFVVVGDAKEALEPMRRVADVRLCRQHDRRRGH